MAVQLTKHGTQAGYRAEIAMGKPCERCSAAHRVYLRQYSKIGKLNGLKYGVHDVIDHLDKRYARSNRPTPSQSKVESSRPYEFPDDTQTGSEDNGGPNRDGPSVAERMVKLLTTARTPDSGNEYVSEAEEHEYIREIDHDPEPDDSGEWRHIDDEDIVINEAGMKKIQENLAFYLVTVGMTLEILDPYCGSVMAEHANNMVDHWSKVIAHYPGIAKHFLSEKGGVIFAWINALQATWPVLVAIYNHHLAGTVKVEDGIIYKINKQGVKRPMPDATMPPVPDSYAYSTR